MKYIVCSLCGAHLDHGEKCSCREEIEKYKNKIAAAVNIGKGGQLEMKVCCNG